MTRSHLVGEEEEEEEIVEVEVVVRGHKGTHSKMCCHSFLMISLTVAVSPSVDTISVSKNSPLTKKTNREMENRLSIIQQSTNNRFEESVMMT
jgi:hypothetical protein